MINTNSLATIQEEDTAIGIATRKEEDSNLMKITSTPCLNPNSNQHITTSLQRMLHYKKMRGGFIYSKDEIMSILDTVQYICPIGPDEWTQEAEMHTMEDTSGWVMVQV